MKKIESTAALDIVLTPFAGIKYSTNAYFTDEESTRMISSNLLFFESFADNLLFYKYIEEFGFFKLYYNIISAFSPINIVDTRSFVMEIPYRGSKNFPTEIVEFWNNSGFDTHITRDLLGLVRPDLSSLILANSEFEYTFVDNLNLVDLICESIKDAFDKFTGDILTVKEVVSAVENREVIGSYKDGDLAGFIRFYSKNTVSWIGHLVVLPNYMGKGVGKSLVAHYLKMRSDQGYTKFQQWVVSDNDAALKLYSDFGFKFINKSSISLLKR